MRVCGAPLRRQFEGVRGALAGSMCGCAGRLCGVNVRVCGSPFRRQCEGVRGAFAASMCCAESAAAQHAMLNSPTRRTARTKMTGKVAMRGAVGDVSVGRGGGASGGGVGVEDPADTGKIK